MLAEISKEDKGPEILYEISSPVEESPADIKEENLNDVADKTEENINIPTEKNQEPSISSVEKNETNNTPEVERNQLPPFKISVSKYSTGDCSKSVHGPIDSSKTYISKKRSLVL